MSRNWFATFSGSSAGTATSTGRERVEQDVVIVDSSVWIAHFNGHDTPEVRVLHEALGSVELGVGDLILSQVLQGFRDDSDYRAASRALRSFELFEMVGVELAEASAQNYRLLRKRGITIRKTMDVLIATFVIVRDFQLLHADRDFDPFERELGLRVVHPPTL